MTNHRYAPRPLRHPIAAVAIVAGTAAFALVTLGAGNQPNRVNAVFTHSGNIVSGIDVRVAGRRVGSVTDVGFSKELARLELGIDDERIWPLPGGTTARIRYGGTIRYGNRYVELKLGDEPDRPVPADGILPLASTEAPVEFDEILGIYDRDTRAHLTRLLERTASAFGDRPEKLGALIEESPAAFDESAALLSQLGGAPLALRRLVRGADATAHTLASARESFGDLVTSAAATFDEIAANAVFAERTIDHLPGTLGTTERVLGRADTTLIEVDDLAADLTSGARALRRLASPASSALARLRDVAPLATGTLRAGTRALPPLSKFVRRGPRLMKRVRSIGQGITPTLGCVLPYGPEMAGLLSTWAGYAKNYDGTDHYSRTLISAATFPWGTPLTSEELTDLNAVVQYAFPRPPGLNAGQPRFMPECGVGPESLDPSQDPEADPTPSTGPNPDQRAGKGSER